VNFNYQQKTTALGHVVALVVIICLCYVAFMGLVYLTGGQLMPSAVAAAMSAVLLFLLTVFIQRQKGCSRHFNRHLNGERIGVPLLLAAGIVVGVPFTHFFTVNSHEQVVKEDFKQALAHIQPMFDAYEQKADKRIENYRKHLNQILANSKKKQKAYANAGFTRHAEGKPSGADTLMRNDMVTTLRRQLLPPAYTTLRKEAVEWAERSAVGATTWNVFLLGNSKEIRKAVDEWQQQLLQMMEGRLANEPAVTDTTALDNVNLQEAVRRLSHVETLCAQQQFPTPLSLLLLAVCLSLLFFPYWLQTRHSKSWARFWPAWMRQLWHRKPDANYDLESVRTIPLHLGRHTDHTNMAHPVSTAAQRFRKQLEDSMAVKDPITVIEQQLREQQITQAALLSLINEDHNLLDADTIGQCISRGLLTDSQLQVDGGIGEEFLRMIGTRPKDVLPEAGNIQEMVADTTEVFFWGIPSSGKTCALGTLFCALDENRVAKNCQIDENSQGHGYYTTLRRIFRQNGDMVILPGRTVVDANFAIHLTLDDRQGKSHPVTLVDMAGELFCAILWEQAQMDHLITDRHRKAKAEFEKIFINKQSEHQKIHVFVIEYGAENRVYKGISQDHYMEHGLRYLESTGVLKDATQGIYLMITKTDQVGQYLQEGETFEQHLDRYINTYYPNFIQLLDNCCHDNELCGGKVPAPIPFDIGEVCFRNFCKLSTERAHDLVKVLLHRSKGFRKGTAGELERIFEK
jgi:hypothetical protein